MIYHLFFTCQRFGVHFPVLDSILRSYYLLSSLFIVHQHCISNCRQKFSSVAEQHPTGRKLLNVFVLQNDAP